MAISFSLSLLCLVGTLYLGSAVYQPRVFPSKKVRLQKAAILGVCSLTFFFIGLLIHFSG